MLKKLKFKECFLVIIMISANYSISMDNKSFDEMSDTETIEFLKKYKDKEALENASAKGSILNPIVIKSEIDGNYYSVPNDVDSAQINDAKPNIKEIKKLETINSASTTTALTRIKNIVPYLKVNVTENVRCNIEGFAGWIPYNLYLVIENFQYMLQNPNDLKRKKLFKNRLFLYGPRGNGKTLLAEKIANITDSIFVKINGPEMITKFQGSGSESIKEVFDNIQKHLSKNKYKGIVVLIDEIDSFAEKNDADTSINKTYKDALANFWLKLDSIENNPQVLVIATTNIFDKLDARLIERFGGNKIKLENPSKEMRKEIIEYYMSYFEIELSPTLKSDLIEKSNNWGARNIKDCLIHAQNKANNKNTGIINKDILLESITELTPVQETKKLSPQEELLPYEKAALTAGAGAATATGAYYWSHMDPATKEAIINNLKWPAEKIAEIIRSRF